MQPFKGNPPGTIALLLGLRRPRCPANRSHELTMNALLDAPACCPAAPSGANDKSIRILVAEDDATVRQMEAMILESDGHRVDTAEDGESAWEALQAGYYDLLVTDYIMPGVSGLALARQLRIAKKALPIVMISGSLDSLDTAKLARDPWSRIHAFVRKPFSHAELLSAVHSALGSLDEDGGGERRPPSGT
jgi:CheY-like chemotaxis protein